MKNKLFERITRSFAPPTRIVAMLFTLCAFCATTSAWAVAPTPTAVWEGNFDVPQNGYSITLPSGMTYSKSTTGNIVIGSTAKTGAIIELNEAVDWKVSVLIKYSHLYAVAGKKVSLATVKDSSSNVIGIRSTANNALTTTGFHNGNDTDYGFVNGQRAQTGSGYLLFSYNPNDGTFAYTGRTINSLSGGKNGTLRWGGKFIDKLSIGGPVESGKTEAWAGVVIEKVALFVGEAYTNENIADYAFPSQTRWHDTDTYAYRGASSSSYFHLSNLEPVDCFDTLEGDTITLDATTDSYYWKKFASNQGATYYKAPGCALFYDKTGYTAQADCTFGPLSFGGLYVTSEQTTGVNPVYYSIIGSGERNTELGDPDGKTETYFVFDKSFTIRRSGDKTVDTKLYGVMNVSIASDMTFDLNSQPYDASHSSIKSVLTTAGTTAPVLKMSGGGKFKVYELDASIGTLDFSGVTATPFIDGSLTVTKDTKLVLPAGIAEGDSYVICSGTLVAPTGVLKTTVQVGDGSPFTGYVTYNAVSKSVSYSTTPPSYTCTVDGSSATWSVDGLTADNFAAANVTFTGSGTVAFDFDALSINVGAGVTVIASSPSLSATVMLSDATSVLRMGTTGTLSGGVSGSGVLEIADSVTTTVPSSVTFSHTGGTTIGANATLRMDNNIKLGTSKVSGVATSTLLFENINNRNDMNYTNLGNWGLKTAATWKGTVEFKNSTCGLADPKNWGNANSAIRFNNVTSYLYPAQSAYTGKIEIASGGWNIDGDYSGPITFEMQNATWSGVGTLTISIYKADQDATILLPANASSFEGAIAFASGARARVVFGSSNTSLEFANKDVIVESGATATIASGKTWTAEKVVVNGTLTLGGETSSISGTVTGSGKIVYPSGGVFPSLTGLNAAGWTGEVEVPAFTSSGTTEINCNNLGNQNSTLVFKGITRNSWDYIYVSPAGYTINPTIQLDGNVELTSGVAPPYVTSFAKVTGGGNFALDRVWVGAKINYKINTLENYTGTLSAQRCEDGGVLAEMSLSLGTLALAGGSSPSTSDRLVKISSESTLSNIVDVDDISVTIGGNATEYKLVKKNVGTPTAGLYLAPAVIKDTSGNLTPYETVQAAFTALEGMDYSTFDYIAVYETATVQYYSANENPPKTKVVGDDVSLTVNSPENNGDYCWTPTSVSELGVTSYNYGPKPTTYTWVGAENANWSATASWKYDATHNANRELTSDDTAIVENGAVVTIDKDGAASSITISGDVTFTATSAKTITVGNGGVVLSALGDSLTLTNVTLSKAPTTTAEALAVQTTGGGENPTVFEVVNAVASVGGIGYATMAEAEEALKTADAGSLLTLQQDYDGTVTIYPGKGLLPNGHTVTLVAGADTDGTTDEAIVVTYNSRSGYYSCFDYRTDSWKGGVAYWTATTSWSGGFVPTAVTAVTIPATEGHSTAITLTGDVSIKSLTLGAGETLTLSRSGETARTLTTSQAIVLTSGQSIVTNPGVTISPAITTEDANSYVKSVTSEGATTYTVAAHKATVYDSEDAEVKKYDSVVDAFAAATDGQKITLFANSNDAITLSDKSITFNEGSFTFTGSFTGNGTVELTSTLKSAATARWAEGWTGTVVLPENANVSGCNFDNYGIAGSTVRLTGDTTATWLSFSNNNNNPVAPTIEIPEGASFTLANTGLSSSFAYTFDAIKGAGAFTVNISGDIDLSYSGYSAYFLLKDVSNFTGSLSATGAGIAIGDTRIANTVAGGKIIVSAGKTATIATGKTWSAANGIVVDGTLDVAGIVTDSIAGGTGNGAKTLNVNSGAAITMGTGKTISGLAAVNLKGGSVDLGKLAAATTQKYVAFSGESTLTLECEYSNGSGVIFNGDTIESPFIKVESGATLNLSYGNFSGWNGDVCDGYIVNEGTLNISQKGSVSTFFRNHLILTDGCTTTIGGTGKLSLYGGVATESTAQIQLASGAAEISSASAGIGFGNVSNSGGYGGKGVGITVGDNATLTISAQIYASSVSSGSNPVAKYGNGTLVLSNASNSPAEPWTLNAGVIKSVVALTVNSGDASKRVSDVSADGYHVYSLVPSPAEVATTTFSFNTFTYGGQPVSLAAGDTIVVPADCTGNQWDPSLSNAAGHPVIVRKSMNWKAGIGTMTIDSGVTVFAYGNNGSAINDGAVISGAGTLQLQDTVPVRGKASVSCTVGGDGTFSLADGATLTVAFKLADGKVTTSVANKCVSYNSETKTYSLVFEATTTGVEITAADAGAAIAAAAVSLTSAQKTQGLEESYYKLVATEKTGENGKWIVTAELDETKVGVEFTAAPALTASTATFTLGSGTKKGLYYGIATISNPAAVRPEVTVIAEAKAETDGQTIVLTPSIDFGSGNVIYYRWSVSDTQRLTGE